MERTEVNVITGEVKIIPLTPEEIEDIKSRPSPKPLIEPTPAEKLAAAGLTVAELKTLVSG